MTGFEPEQECPPGLRLIDDRAAEEVAAIPGAPAPDFAPPPLPDAAIAPIVRHGTGDRAYREKVVKAQPVWPGGAGRITGVTMMPGGGMFEADARELLAGYRDAGVVIGYGPLRVGPAERRPDLPDALVLAGGAHARLAQHDRALDRLLRTAEAGPPEYGFGLDYLVDRLRNYAATKGAPA